MIVSKTKSKIPPHPELRGSIKHLKYPVIAEVKLDGEFNFLIYKKRDLNAKEDCFLVNKYGTVKRHFPALDKIKEILEQRVNTAMLVCEVYWSDGKLGRLYDLLSHKKDDNLNISVFDIIGLNGDIRKNTLLDRLEMLNDIGLANLTPRSELIYNEADLTSFFTAITQLGYEGIVAKSLLEPFPSGPCSWSKMKYKDRTDYLVTFIDPVKERIEVQVPTSQGTFIAVGVKAPNRYKRHIKLGDAVTIEHQGVLASGSLRHPVLICKAEWR